MPSSNLNVLSTVATSLADIPAHDVAAMNRVFRHHIGPFPDNHIEQSPPTSDTTQPNTPDRYEALICIGCYSYGMMSNQYLNTQQGSLNPSFMTPQPCIAASRSQPTAANPAGSVMAQTQTRRLSAYGGRSMIPYQQLLVQDAQQATHIVKPQGRRGILPNAAGRAATPTGTGTSENTVTPQKDADGKFPCPHCTKTYLHAKHLKRHLLRHTGDRPYMCVLCRNTFSRSDILKRHFQKCSIRRGNPTGASHLPHPQGRNKENQQNIHNRGSDMSSMSRHPHGPIMDILQNQLCMVSNRSTPLCLLPERSDTGGLDVATKRSSACISAAGMAMQSHGQKRTPYEFNEIREAWKAHKKEEDQQREAAEEAGWQLHAQAVASSRTHVQNGGPDGGDAGQPLSSVQGLPIGCQAATDPSTPSVVFYTPL
ncbi:Uu.00g136630.m01.CDS01 [Anthostomella pinea]|uniref:Uu.00g136630.m01.CDS01 n=1 Tax=Anthostomella pinea TaxID=933095 RepID=A0AAI8VQA7_9PEZI|nr:Uu.00g136630.m01.CDS01 [Anthostomella pinea]